MLELDVCIVDVLCDGKHTHFVAQACVTNSVLKCLLSEEQQDARRQVQVGVKVRLRIINVDFARSEPLIRVRVMTSPEEATSAGGPRKLPAVPHATGSENGACVPGRRKRIFFDLLQDAL